MRPIAMTRSTVLGPVYAAAHQVNVPVERIARKQRLPFWDIDDPDSWVPTNAVVMLAADIRKLVGPNDFGQFLDAATGMSALGPLGDIILRSRTLADALRQYLNHYCEFRPYAQVGAAWRNDELWIRRGTASWVTEHREILQLYALAEISKLVGLVANDEWTPTRITLDCHAEAMLRAMPHLAAADVSFDPEFCGIAIPAHLLSLPIRTPRSGAAEPTSPNWSSPPKSLADCVRAVISTHLSEGYPVIEDVAESIGLNVRTMQRRLLGERTSYKDLVDQYRYEAAKRLMEESELSCINVALELGYNDAGSFTRAFQRWAGVSPQQYRHARRAG